MLVIKGADLLRWLYAYKYNVHKTVEVHILFIYYFLITALIYAFPICLTRSITNMFRLCKEDTDRYIQLRRV